MDLPIAARFNFSLATDEHFDWFKKLYTDPEVMAKIPGGMMETANAEASAKKAVKGYKDYGLGYWVVTFKDGSNPVAYVVLRPFDWDQNFDGIEIGYIIDKKFWGKAIASDAVRAVVDFALNQLNFPKLLALVNNENVASIKVLEKIGFKKNLFQPKKYPNNSIWELKNWNKY